jgi:hypothetical protein
VDNFLRRLIRITFRVKDQERRLKEKQSLKLTFPLKIELKTVFLGMKPNQDKRKVPVKDEEEASTQLSKKKETKPPPLAWILGRSFNLG